MRSIKWSPDNGLHKLEQDGHCLRRWTVTHFKTCPRLVMEEIDVYVGGPGFELQIKKPFGWTLMI